jgi:hypothetical protein
MDEGKWVAVERPEDIGWDAKVRVTGKWHGILGYQSEVAVVPDTLERWQPAPVLPKKYGAVIEATSKYGDVYVYVYDGVDYWSSSEYTYHEYDILDEVIDFKVLFEGVSET